MQLDSETRMRALSDGAEDAMMIFADLLGEVGDNPDLVLGEAPAIASVQMLVVNKSRSALAEPAVREAISHAIDRAGIGAALFEDKCSATGQPFAVDSPYSDPSVAPDPYDPELAKQLLADAGYPDGFEFESVMANVSWLVAEAEAVQAQLAEIGVTMNISPLEPAQVLDRFLSKKDADTWFTALQSQVDPGKTVAQAMLPASVYNPGGYENATIVELAGPAVATIDRDQRVAQYQQISAAFAEDNFHLAICSLPTFFAHHQNVHGLRPNLSGTFDFREVWIA
jgi:peptide/nickel transport system substrate-binding protein